MENITYCSIVYRNDYDDSFLKVVYCGLDYEQAKENCINYEKQNHDNDGSYVDYWQNGKVIKSEEIQIPKNPDW
jgi:hypothetical protein